MKEQKMSLSSLKRVKSTGYEQAQPSTAAKPEAGAAGSELDGVLISPEKEPPGTPIQRSFISEGREERLRLQLWLADNLRQSIVPEIPLDLPLERTPQREQLIAQRYQQAMQRANLRVPADVTP